MRCSKWACERIQRRSRTLNIISWNGLWEFRVLLLYLRESERCQPKVPQSHVIFWTWEGWGEEVRLLTQNTASHSLAIRTELSLRNSSAFLVFPFDVYALGQLVLSFINEHTLHQQHEFTQLVSNAQLTMNAWYQLNDTDTPKYHHWANCSKHRIAKLLSSNRQTDYRQTSDISQINSALAITNNQTMKVRPPFPRLQSFIACQTVLGYYN